MAHCSTRLTQKKVNVLFARVIPLTLMDKTKSSEAEHSQLDQKPPNSLEWLISNFHPEVYTNVILINWMYLLSWKFETTRNNTRNNPILLSPLEIFSLLFFMLHHMHSVSKWHPTAYRTSQAADGIKRITTPRKEYISSFRRSKHVCCSKYEWVMCIIAACW